MELNEIIDIYNEEQRRTVSYPRHRREETPYLVRLVAEDPASDGVIVYSDLRQAQADRLPLEQVIQDEIAYFRALKQAFEWKAYSFDYPGDLIQRLENAGFALEQPDALAVLDVSAAPSRLFDPVDPAVRRLSDPQRIQDVVAVETAIWEQDFSDLGHNLARDLVERPERLSVFVAYQDQKPVSAAWTYYHPGASFASLWGGSTLPENRRQGLYSALVAARLQEAHARGVRFLTVDASPESRPILEKLGFQVLGASTPCKWTPEIA